MGSSLIESAPPAIDPLYGTDSVHHDEKDKKIYIFRPPIRREKGKEEEKNHKSLHRFACQCFLHHRLYLVRIDGWIGSPSSLLYFFYICIRTRTPRAVTSVYSGALLHRQSGGKKSWSPLFV